MSHVYIPPHRLIKVWVCVSVCLSIHLSVPCSEWTHEIPAECRVCQLFPLHYEIAQNGSTH